MLRESTTPWLLAIRDSTLGSIRAGLSAIITSVVVSDRGADPAMHQEMVRILFTTEIPALVLPPRRPFVAS